MQQNQTELEAAIKNAEDNALVLEPARPGEETLTSGVWVASGSHATIARMEAWGPSLLLRWSKAGKLQQQWYEQFRGAVEWRDVLDEEGQEATSKKLTDERL